jgi:predicted enzyme related to lactoylglutathione lyase
MSTNGFVWYELMTGDVAAAATFYATVVGWTAADSGMPGIDYTLLGVGDRHVAGIMEVPAEAKAMGAKPGWIGYVGVPDADAATDAATAAGATVLKAPQDIPGVGRFSVLVDPAGAVFCLFTGIGDPAPALPPMSPGAIGWHELVSKAPETAWPFYAGQFGWTKGEALDMGEMGTYQLFSTSGGTAQDSMSGGMMKVPEGAPFSGWTYYFVVDDIDAAATRVADAGGTLAMGPVEVPGGAWIIQGHDPQGAPFALVGLRAQG